MTTPTDVARYDRTAMALHWLMAGLIIAAFALALVVDFFPRSIKPIVVETHKDIGIAILLLLALRVLWRLTHRPPALSDDIGALTRRASSLGHLGLYALMVAVPVIGIIYAFWRGQGLHLGLVDIPSPWVADRPTSRQFKEIHELAAYALIGLAGLHAAAALWHHYVRQDGVLRRMMPAR